MLRKFTSIFKRSGKEKRTSFGEKKILFLRNNVPAHQPVIATVKIYQLRFELLKQLPYISDFIFSDCHRFPNLKKILSGRRFQSDVGFIDVVNKRFSELNESHYTYGLIILEHQIVKCISIFEVYVEKCLKK